MARWRPHQFGRCSSQIYAGYHGDKRKKEYTEYLLRKSLALGILKKNDNENVIIEKVLQEQRTASDLCKIVMLLSVILPIPDLVIEVVAVTRLREALSTRAWYVSIYSLIRESKINRILSGVPLLAGEWLHCSVLRGCLEPIPQQHREESLYLHGADHYYRIIDHDFTEPTPEARWIKDESDIWVRKLITRPYVPLAISWYRRRVDPCFGDQADMWECKFTFKFLEENRRKLTQKKYGVYKFSPKSPWIRIECGNRHYYRDKETRRKQRSEPSQGFSNVNIADIYYFDREYPILYQNNS